MTGIEWQTAGAAALLSAAVNFLFYFAFRRSLELRDREYDKLDEQVKNLSERRVTVIENRLLGEADKRKTIYERLEKLEIGQISRNDFIASVLRLEHIATETDRLIKWLDDVSKEQISHGKDMSALAARLERMEENRG